MKLKKIPRADISKQQQQQEKNTLAFSDHRNFEHKKKNVCRFFNRKKKNAYYEKKSHRCVEIINNKNVSENKQYGIQNYNPEEFTESLFLKTHFHQPHLLYHHQSRDQVLSQNLGEFCFSGAGHTS